ncbi:MAG: mechanosensitive ion channel family protein, partial [Alistipes ihumii]|nr:mechanosensitive ion channel family protein [Alistipes ihumii]
MKERYMEVRVLFSSSDSGSRWDLSVDVREKLLKFLQDNYPDCFVRTRIMDVGPAAKDGSAGA